MALRTATSRRHPRGVALRTAGPWYVAPGFGLARAVTWRSVRSARLQPGETGRVTTSGWCAVRPVWPAQPARPALTRVLLEPDVRRRPRRGLPEVRQQRFMPVGEDLQQVALDEGADERRAEHVELHVVQ